VIVVRFTTPSIASDTSQLQINPTAAYPQISRLVTLSTDPFSCLIAGSPTSFNGVIATTTGTFAVLNFTVGAPVFGRTTLLPGTTYYVTYVNRNTYGAPAAQGSCTAGDCKMDIHFQN